MIQCQQCGHNNSSESNFCRGCGVRLNAPPVQSSPPPSLPSQTPPPQNNYEYEPPRPYSWKTDEYQTQTEARQNPTVKRSPQTLPTQAFSAHQPPAPLGFHQQSAVAHGYRCPNCGTNYLPITERRISSAGWITFALLLVFTFVFFWIGLLIKEQVSICPVCRTRVG